MMGKKKRLHSIYCHFQVSYSRHLVPCKWHLLIIPC